MTQRFVARSFDPLGFARSAGRAAGEDLLSDFGRLSGDLAQGVRPDAPVCWSARGEIRSGDAGQDQAWLHLKIDVVLPLTCQRCLGVVEVPVAIERSFRFVADEASAEAQDDACEEDVLALQRDFDLHHLIEDELLMELPLVPRHALCPVEVKLAVADVGFVDAAAERPHPFAGLARLQGGKTS